MESTKTVAAERGVNETDQRKIAEALARSMADTYTLYLKTQNAHWNVTGHQFFGLHKALEEQYQQLAEAADTMAERIRALGYPVNATLEDFKRTTTVQEKTSTDGAALVKGLIEGHEATVKTLRAAFDVADAADDQGTADLLGSRVREHEKTMWMLRSVLD